MLADIDVLGHVWCRLWRAVVQLGGYDRVCLNTSFHRLLCHLCNF